jgi:hypothetical protein
MVYTIVVHMVAKPDEVEKLKYALRPLASHLGSDGLG